MSKCRQQQYYGRCSGNRPSQSNMPSEMPYKGMVPAGTMLECECDCTLSKIPPMTDMMPMTSERSYPSMSGMQGGYGSGYMMDNRGGRCMKDNRCGCMKESKCSQERRCYVNNNMQNFSLAMAYVPWQPFQNVYEDAEGFDAGTIFADLNLDFCGRRCN